MRSELAVCRSTLNDLIRYLKEKRAAEVKRVSTSISELLELRSDDALREKCSRILPSIQGVHESVKNLQHEINWRCQMSDSEKWADAIEKVTKMTDQGSLNWQQAGGIPMPNLVRDDVLGDIYVATVQGRWMAIYEYRDKSYLDDTNWHWEDAVAVEFIDNTGKLQWRWPFYPAAWQLLDAVKRQVTGADDFLRQFLA